MRSELEECHKRSVHEQMNLMSHRSDRDRSCDNVSAQIHDCSNSIPCTSDDAFFRLKVGLRSYRIRIETVLKTRENSLMNVLVRGDHNQRMTLVDAFLPDTGEYYIERNGRVAEHVLDYYITGLLHMPADVCAERFREELEFWNVHGDQLAPCCAILGETPEIEKPKPTEYDSLEKVCFSRTRRALWLFLEDPQSSCSAKIFAILSVVFVLLSIFGLILGSMPEFQEDPSQADAYHMLHYGSRCNSYSQSPQSEQNSKIAEQFPNFVYRATDSPNMVLITLEYICMVWFTIEYIVRLVISPQKIKFFTQGFNLIDLSTILPFYLEIALPFIGIQAEELRELSGAMLVVRVLRVLRMARVFKLARYSTGLQTFGSTLHSSVTELTMLGMFLVTGIIFFSTVMYFLERDEPGSEFYSIPAACWWCVVTMTTIGYGDSIPRTSVGKMIAISASICGIIVLAFPISMIVEKFASAQQKAIEREASKQAQMAAMANRYLNNRFPSRRKAYGDLMLSSINRMWSHRKSVATIA